MKKFACGWLIGVLSTFVVTAYGQHVAITDVGFMLAGGIGPDKNAHQLWVNKDGSVKCADGGIK